MSREAKRKQPSSLCCHPLFFTRVKNVRNGRHQYYAPVDVEGRWWKARPNRGYSLEGQTTPFLELYYHALKARIEKVHALLVLYDLHWIWTKKDPAKKGAKAVGLCVQVFRKRMHAVQ